MDPTITSPKVTVLMPVYNGQQYLKEAIESILNQEFTDFEFLIINDGSTDESAGMIASYTDPRIRVINNEKNIGLVNTLNKALELCKGEYIVRMDCDDISLKDRLKVQVAFMDKNKNIGASGSSYYLFRNNKKNILHLPLTEKEIECYFAFNCPIAHPSAIIRRSVIQDNNIHYSSEYMHAEDYSFWTQIAIYSSLANIAEPLLIYRVHDNQITGNTNFTTRKNKSLEALRNQHVKKLNITPSSEETATHAIVSNGIAPKNTEQLQSAEKWLKKLIVANEITMAFDKNYFNKIILERWLRSCINYSGSKKGLTLFIQSEIYKIIKLPLQMKIDLLGDIYNSWKRKTSK